MSSGTLSPEVLQSLKETMKSAIVEMLPKLIMECVPVITQIFKELTPVVMESTRQFCSENPQTNSEEVKLQHANLFTDFKRRHKKHLDELLGRRTSLHKRALTLDWQLQLYEQYLSREIIYIPKVYRKDDYFVRDEEELASVKKFEEARFRSEVEIMTKRKNHMMQEIAKIDESVRKIVMDDNLPSLVEKFAIERWYASSHEYTKHSIAEEEKKRLTTMEAHKKDEIFYKKHQVERLQNITSKHSMKMDIIPLVERTTPAAPVEVNS